MPKKEKESKQHEASEPMGERMKEYGPMMAKKGKKPSSKGRGRKGR
jgi:hypothetical protein